MRSAIVGGGGGAVVNASTATPSGQEAPMKVWSVLEPSGRSARPIELLTKLDQ
jgi:hypothetical protein